MIVVDTNQAAGPGAFAQRQLCVPELVLAEVAVRPGPVRTRVFGVWRPYRLRFGLTPKQILEDLAGLDVRGIAAYRPFASQHSVEARMLSRALRGKLPDVEFRAWAEQSRQSGFRFGAEMKRRSEQVRAELRAQKAGKAGGMAEVSALSQDESSYVGQLMISGIRNAGKRTPVVNDDRALFQALSFNPYLRNFMRGLLFYTVAISRLWSDQPRNLDPQPTRNDFTDVSLPLYVRDHRDVVWTEDGFVRNLLVATECGVRVKP